MKSRSLMAVCLLRVAAVAVPNFTRADVAPEQAPAPTATPATEPSGPVDYKQLYEEQKKRNDELEKRITILEEKDQAAPYVEKEGVTESILNYIKKTEISGFVSSSYIYNFNQPSDHLNNGHLYDYQDNQFMLNKFDIVVQHPVEFNAIEWQAGYYTEFIFGHDALYTRSKSPDSSLDGLFNLGDNGDLEQSYVQFNVPVGNGLKVLFGKYVTPMGYELVENELNVNWSSGWQWTYVEPFTHTGLELMYKVNDKWEVDFLANNGWDTVKDNNSSKSFMGRVAWTPNDKTSLSFIAYGGPEQSDNVDDPDNAVPGANGNWRYGIDFVGTYQITEKLSTAMQWDWGQEQNGDPTDNVGLASWWAVGSWWIYDLTEKVQAGFRADYLSDRDGNRTSDFLFPANTGQDLVSLTLTLNIKPVENLRFAPEIRYDHSSLNDAFTDQSGAQDWQFLTSIGVVYLF
jgi:hypothetical protein